MLFNSKFTPIDIKPDKHVSIVFDPRSGSHVLSHLLSELSDKLNLGEYFNFTVQEHSVTINQENKTAALGGSNAGQQIDLTDDEKKRAAESRLQILNELTAISKYAVCKVLPYSYINVIPDLSARLYERNDMQFIRLLRADVLYGYISVRMCNQTGIWHSPNNERNTTAKLGHRDYRMIHLPIEEIEIFLNRYVRIEKHIETYFPNIPAIYYEEFQTSPLSVLKKFIGIRKELVSIPFNKFVGNYKEQISNIDEVEDFYEQFVNEHAEYFPQYFGEVPNLTIPQYQGRQPRNLLQTEMSN